jgi:enterochelin esterase-like enzyme
VTELGVTFYLPDPELALESVLLVQEIRRPRRGPRFVLPDGSRVWELFIERPNIDRMEYRFELVRKNGGSEVVCDPANPSRASEPFGFKSVVEFPGYHPPEWVEREPPPAGEVLQLSLPSRVLRCSLPLMIWTSPGATLRERLPLLVVHDGPEYAQFSSLTKLLDAMSSRGLLPPMRAALLGPVDRNQIYSASAAYAHSLSHEIFPALSQLAPAPDELGARVGMGASLGALAMLHAHRVHPALFGALFLQSGSFFRQRFDPQESGFVRWRRVTRFVGRVSAVDHWDHPIPVVMTCGSVEENLANNQALRDALVTQDYEVGLQENRDAHNWIGWRDALDPHLVALLKAMWT